MVRNAARAVALALNGLVHPAFDVVADFREARNMDEERLRLELALDGGVNFGMTEGTKAAIAGIGLTIVVVALDQIVDVSLLDGVRADGIHRVLHPGRPFATESYGVGDNAVANTHGIHVH